MFGKRVNKLTSNFAKFFSLTWQVVYSKLVNFVNPLTPKTVNGFINILFVGGILTPCCVPFAHCQEQGSKALQMLLCRAGFRVSDF